MYNVLHWVDLVEAGQESESCGDDNVYGIMADIILASEAPTEGKSSLVHRLNRNLIANSHHCHATGKYNRWQDCENTAQSSSKSLTVYGLGTLRISSDWPAGSDACCH